MFIKNLLLLISILLISHLSTAQSEDKIEDLKLSIQEEQDEAKKAELYIELAKIHISNNPKEGLIYGQKGLALSRKIQEPTLIFRAAETIFGLHYKMANSEGYNDSLSTYIEIIEQANEKINQPLYQVKTFKNKGTYYYVLRDYEKAIDFNIKGYELSKKHQLSDNIQARLLNNLSNVLYRNKNYNEAIKYYKQALALADNDLQKGRTLFNIGSLYRNELNQHDTAYIYFNEAHSYFEKVNNKQFQAITLMNKGNYFDYKKEFDKAMSFYQEAYTIITDNNLSYYFNIINRNFASHYYLSNQYQLAIQYGEKSISWETLNSGGYEEETYQILHKSYAKVGNYKKAYQLQQGYISYKDSMELVKLDNKVEELQTKFQVKEQEAENDLLKANIQRKNIINIGSVLILILSIIIIWVLRRSNQIKKSQNEILEEKVTKRTNELLSTTKELEQIKAIKLLEEAKSRFFANVSHEFRTPLTLIQGPLQSIVKSPRLNLKEQKMINRALGNSKNLSRLVNQILDLSKLDADKMTVDEEPIVLFLLIRRIIANFESYAQRNGIKLQLEYRIYHELKINLDKDKFEQVLNNYISNAIKFTPRDGKISIIVTDLQADIQIAVADTGIGIPKDEIDAVFDRYYQVKGFEKDAPLGEINHYTGGTGIGLSLCKDYAELFGGKVWAESPDDGKGSTFYFQFPKKELFEATDNQDALDIVALQAMPIAALSNIKENQVTAISKEDNSKILIVEDNHDLRAFLKELLEEDYQVITVENGQAALDEMNNNAFELVISDVMMPIMDGFQLLEQLKATDKHRHIPMMMLTARAEFKDKLKALRLGVDDYMLKPFDETELKARVSNLILNINSRREALANEKPQNDKVDIPDLEHSNQDNEWLQALEEKVFTNIPNINFTSDSLAEELLMSRSHLFRKTKSLTGLTVNQYIKEAKLQTARTLLEQRKVNSVKETAYQVGFKHIHYFSQSYVKRFGKKPSEYF